MYVLPAAWPNRAHCREAAGAAAAALSAARLAPSRRFGQKPWPQLSSRFAFGELSGALLDPRGDPIRKWRDHVAVGACLCVLLLDRGQFFLADEIGEADQCSPEASMDEGDLPVDQPKAKHVGTITNRGERVKYLRAFRMAPPAAAYGFARDRLGDAGDRSSGRREDDAVPLHETDGIERGLHA